MDEGERLRRALLGDEYVDAVSDGSDFQAYINQMAWGVWARGGPLSTRDRSLLVLAVLATLGRMPEFTLHLGAAPRAGVTDEEIDELLLQVAAYAGAPAGVAARRAVLQVRAAREQA